MLGEGQRGGTLEQCLCKLLAQSPQNDGEMTKNEGIQIVAMSATLSSTRQILRFLRAHLFTTDFRPVQLLERVKIGDTIYKVDRRGQGGKGELLVEEIRLKNVSTAKNYFKIFKN